MQFDPGLCRTNVRFKIENNSNNNNKGKYYKHNARVKKKFAIIIVVVLRKGERPNKIKINIVGTKIIIVYYSKRCATSRFNLFLFYLVF